MNSDEQDNPLDEFKKILNEGEEIGKDIADQGRDRTEKGQELADLSRSAKNVLDCMAPGQSVHGIEDAIEDWHFYIDRSRQERDNYSPLGIDIVSSASSTASIYSSDLFCDIEISTPEPYKSKITVAVSEYEAVFERSADKARALDLLSTFGLDEPFQDRRSASEQFEIAYDAINRPVSGKTDPSQTSLIPMREAIETSLDHLLYMRPKRTNVAEAEGKNKDWRKIIAIAEQLRKDGVPDSLVQSWARDWINLKKNSLSPSKTEQIERGEWRRRINKASRFVIGFLEGLDAHKLR